MKRRRIIFWTFVLGGYTVSRLLPPANRDQVALLLLFLFYMMYLVYKVLSKRSIGRNDVLLGIPAFYGLIISILQYGSYVQVGNLFVWVIFVLISIFALGYMGSEARSNHPR